MSDVEEIKRLLRALLDSSLGEDISSQLRQLLEIPLMTHREALEYHADLVTEARAGTRIRLDDKRTEWKNGEIVYELCKLSESTVYTVKCPINYEIVLRKVTSIDHLFDHYLSIHYKKDDIRYLVTSTPASASVSIFPGDGSHLYLQYDENGLFVSYDSQNDYTDWTIKMDLEDNVRVSVAQG